MPDSGRDTAPLTGPRGGARPAVGGLACKRSSAVGSLAWSDPSMKTATAVVKPRCSISVALRSPARSRICQGDRAYVQIDPLDDAIGGLARTGLWHHGVGGSAGPLRRHDRPGDRDLVRLGGLVDDHAYPRKRDGHARAGRRRALWDELVERESG
jgi:hypothetical protein